MTALSVARRASPPFALAVHDTIKVEQKVRARGMRRRAHVYVYI